MPKFYQNTPLSPSKLGDNVPRRDGKLSPKLADLFLKTLRWQVVGDIPNISQAVLLAVPHTSNMDGVFAIGAVLALDIDIRLMGKKQLFAVPILSHFLKWAGIMPIDRDKKARCWTPPLLALKQASRCFWGLPLKEHENLPIHGKQGFIIWRWGQACRLFLWR